VQGNMGKMMKQIQKMQNDMLRMQEEIKSRTLEATSGGGVVRVVVNGQKEVESLFIDPRL
jgi:nucleoid-associated protein EbfC